MSQQSAAIRRRKQSLIRRRGKNFRVTAVKGKKALAGK